MHAHDHMHVMYIQERVEVIVTTEGSGRVVEEERDTEGVGERRAESETDTCDAYTFRHSETLSREEYHWNCSGGWEDTCVKQIPWEKIYIRKYIIQRQKVKLSEFSQREL